MAPLVVLDSGLLLAVILEEPLSDKADSLFAHWRKHDVQLCAPTLFLYEIVSVIRRSVWQDRLTPEDAPRELETALTMPITFYAEAQLHKRAYELATQLERPTAYDSQYLALAERLGCDFWTADEKLFNAVRGTFNWVKWVGGFAPPDSAES